MKNINLPLIYLFLFSHFSYAQEVHYFNKAITHPDSLNYSLSGFEVEDGFLILNYSHSWQNSILHIELIKLDLQGNLQWQKQLGNVSFFPVVNAMIQDKENPNHFLISYMVDEDSIYINSNITLLKCTKEGNILWKRHYANPELNTRPIRLIHANDDGYLIVGQEGYADTGSMLAIKVDNRGTQEWYHTYPINDGSYGLFANPTLDGGYILSGISLIGTDRDIYIVKISSEGIEEWHKVIDFYNNETSSQAVELSDENYLISATTNFGWETEHYTAILDENGEFIRERNQIIPCLHTIQTRLLPLGNDEFLAGAMLCNPTIDNYFSPYIMHFNSMGDILWTKQFTPSNIVADNVYTRDIKKTSDGGYLMIGYANLTLGPEATPYGWIVKMDAFGNTCWELGCDSTVVVSNIEEVEGTDGLGLSPNPAKDFLQMHIAATLPATLQFQLTNIEGRVVKKAMVEDGKQLEVADLEAGIYIATWLEEGMVLKREKVVILD